MKVESVKSLLQRIPARYFGLLKLKLLLPAGTSELGNWASKASPTQRCSIEISRDICNWASEVSPTLGCSIEISCDIIGERAKRARHSQVCSIENRGYIYI